MEPDPILTVDLDKPPTGMTKEQWGQILVESGIWINGTWHQF